MSRPIASRCTLPPPERKNHGRLDTASPFGYVGDVTAPGPKVAFDPQALQRSVARYVGAAEKNLGFLAGVEDQLQPLLDKLKENLSGSTPATSFDDVERLTIIYDRLVKAGLNLVKASDELHRLQSFLGGGPDSRPDLTSAGEVDLRAILLRGIRALGITDLKQLEPSSESA